MEKKPPYVEISQSKAGMIGKTKILKCDVYSDLIVLKAPQQKGKRDRVILDSCFFKSTTGVKAVLAQRIERPKHVKVLIKKLLKKPQKLGGTDRPR